MAPTPTDISAPLGFDARSGRLEVTLGGRRLDAGPVAPSLGAALVAGLEEVLGGRAIVGGQHRLPLDRDGTRRLNVRHRPEGLELCLLDVDDRPVSPPHPLALAGFARAVHAFAAGHMTGARLADLSALVRWAEALDGDDQEPDLEPRAPTAPPSGDMQPVAPLPVRDLYHLAYRRAWRHEAPGLIEVAADDRRLAVFDVEGLRLLDRISGRVVHAHRDLRPLDGPHAMRCAVDADERPVVLDDDGGIRWRGAAPTGDAPLQGLYIGGPCALAVTAGRDAWGLDPATGETRWRYSVHYGEIYGATVRDTIGWLTAEDGFVHGIDLERGTRRFAVDLGGLDGRPHLGPAGLLVSLDDPSGSRLACLDPASGALRWSSPLPGHLGRPPLTADDAVIAIVEHGAEPMAVVLDARSGAIRWRRRLDGPDLPVARILGGALCLKHIDGALTALDPHTGALRWLIPGDDPELTLRSNPAPVACRGLILLPGTAIRAVDPSDGRIVHSIDCDELVPDRLYVWPDGDLAIAEHDAVARYLLGGHIARVR